MNLGDNPSFIDFTTFKPHPLSKTPSTAVEGDLDRDVEGCKAAEGAFGRDLEGFQAAEGAFGKDLDFLRVSKAPSTGT